MLAVAVLMLGCDGVTGPNYPSIAGTYSGDAFWRFRILNEPLSCQGEVVVASQADSTFSGVFQVGAPCRPAAGAVSGTVDHGGLVAVRLAQSGPSIFATVPNCSHTSGDGTFNGSVSGGQLIATAIVSIDCGRGTGPFQMDVMMNGLRR